MCVIAVTVTRCVVMCGVVSLLADGVCQDVLARVSAAHPVDDDTRLALVADVRAAIAYVSKHDVYYSPRKPSLAQWAGRTPATARPDGAISAASPAPHTLAAVLSSTPSPAAVTALDSRILVQRSGLEEVDRFRAEAAEWEWRLQQVGVVRGVPTRRGRGLATCAWRALAYLCCYGFYACVCVCNRGAWPGCAVCSRVSVPADGGGTTSAADRVAAATAATAAAATASATTAPRTTAAPATASAGPARWPRSTAPSAVRQRVTVAGRSLTVWTAGCRRHTASCTVGTQRHVADASVSPW